MVVVYSFVTYTSKKPSRPTWNEIEDFHKAELKLLPRLEDCVFGERRQKEVTLSTNSYTTSFQFLDAPLRYAASAAPRPSFGAGRAFRSLHGKRAKRKGVKHDEVKSDK